MTSLCDLPNELLMKIFSQFVSETGHVEFFRNVVPTCRRFRQLGNAIWGEVPIRDLNGAAISSLARRGTLHPVSELVMSSDADVSLSPEIFTRLPNLRKLIVSHTSVDDAILKNIASHCTKLTAIEVSLVNTLHSNTLSLFLRERGKALKVIHLKSLKFLSFDFYRGVDVTIAETCPSLEDLVIDFTYFHEDFNVDLELLLTRCEKLDRLHLGGTVVVVVGEVQSKLRSLKLSRVDLKGTPKPLVSILHGFGRCLKVLELNNGELIDDISELVAKSCPLLEKLELRAHFRRFTVDMHELLTGCPGLRSLSLFRALMRGSVSSCELTSLRIRSVCCPTELLCVLLNRNLKSLEVNGFTIDRDPDILSWFSIEKCPFLKELKLAGIHDTLSRVYSFDFKKIIDVCARLKHLYLQNLGMKFCCESATESHIESLCLHNIRFTDPSTFDQFVHVLRACGKTLKKLEMINVILFITGASELYATIVANCPELEELLWKNVEIFDGYVTAHCVTKQPEMSLAPNKLKRFRVLL